VRAGRVIGVTAATALVISALALPRFAVGTGVSVSFEMAPIVSATSVDNGLVIRSNTQWELTGIARAACGSTEIVYASGGSTGAAGALVETGDLTEYTLVPVTPR